MSGNPFILSEIPVDKPFCDRVRQMADFVSYARSQTNAVLFSPRRYGKTSLIKRVQDQLRREGFLTSYCDLFGVTSIEEIAGRITKSIFEITQSREGLFKKAIALFHSFRPVIGLNDRGEMSVSVQPAFKRAGLDTLDETMKALGEFTKKVESPIQIVFDEFQELSEIKDAIAIEGILRSHIQQIPASFIFVGSRRRLLLDMFNDSKRPFFQSAINYALEPLPKDESIAYIVSRFSGGGKVILPEQAETASEMVFQHPGYLQRLCFFLFEGSEKQVKDSDIHEAHDTLLNNEKHYFESILQGLSNKQVALLVALANEPLGKVYSTDFMARHNLGSTGGIQNSIGVLIRRDIIEQAENAKTWSIVDPLFSEWLAKISL